MRSDLLNIKVDDIDLNGLIKTALKAKSSKKLTKKQCTSIALLKEFGYGVKPCEDSCQGYFEVSKNGRNVFISMIADANKGGIFLIENHHQRCLSRNRHDGHGGLYSSWRDEFSNLGYMFDRVDFVRLLTKPKYSQYLMGESEKIQTYKNLKRDVTHRRNDRNWVDRDIASLKYDLESIKKRLSEAESKVDSSQAELDKAIKIFDDFKQNIFTK